MAMTKKSISKSGIVIFFVLSIMHNFFYFLPDKIGPLTPKFILLVALSACCFFADPKHFFRRDYVLFLIPILLSVFSAVMARINFGQSMFRGLAPQRAWIMSYMTIFPVLFCLRSGRLDIEEFWKVLYIVVWVELLICSIQWLLGEEHMFLTMSHGSRYGLTRLYCNCDYAILLGMHTTEQILQKRKLALNIFTLAAVFVFVVIITQHRNEMMALAAALGITVILSKTEYRKFKWGIIIGASVLAVSFLTFTEIGRSICIAIKNMLVSSGDGLEISLDIRKKGQAFYMEKWRSSIPSLLFGYGYGNTGVSQSAEAIGMNQKYLIIDNGISAFIFTYGIMGIIWLLSLFAMLIIKGVRLYKQSGISVILGFIVSLLVCINFKVTYFYLYEPFIISVYCLIYEACSEFGKETSNECNHNTEQLAAHKKC